MIAREENGSKKTLTVLDFPGETHMWIWMRFVSRMLAPSLYSPRPSPWRSVAGLEKSQLGPSIPHPNGRRDPARERFSDVWCRKKRRWRRSMLFCGAFLNQENMEQAAAAVDSGRRPWDWVFEIGRAHV